MSDAAPLTPDLLLRHEAFVLRLARSLVRDEASAQDVTQETLLAALRHAPPAESLRGWLARVVRHRASDQRRSDRRRSDREERVARPESQSPAPGAAERLELEHGVVRAVLALDEPYRAAVVAVYYEGLTPAELARREGVPAGTVRARLSRALEKLRGKLDREHGDRATWGLALVGLLQSREGVVGAAGAGAGASATGSALAAWPVAAAGALAAGATLAVGAWWFARAPEPPTPVVAATSPSEPVPVAAATADLRTPVTVVEAALTDTTTGSEDPTLRDDALAELSELAERTLQLQRAIVERRLEVDPQVAERYAWLVGLPGAGVVRLVERNSMANSDEYDLPWMDGGGAYYSFTERTHDYQRRPQVEMQHGKFLAGFYGSYQGAVVDLGEGPFRGMALDLGSEPSGLSEQQRAAWDLLREPVEDYARLSGSWLSSGLGALGLDGRADIRPGHTYAIRAISPDEFDVLVVVEVADVYPEGCTLAWRVLEDRPVPEPRSLWKPSSLPEDYPELPQEWRRLSIEALRAELDSARARGAALLFDEVPPELRQRFAWLMGREDAGLTRILQGGSRFTHLASERGGGAYWSFGERSHDYDDDPDLYLFGGRFDSAFNGGDTGVVLDLGALPLEAALRGYASRVANDPVEGALVEEVDHSQPRNEVSSALSALSARFNRLPLNPTARIGHSYLVRSIHHEVRDLLAVFEVVGLDERGALIAWQVVRTWPVPSQH